MKKRILHILYIAMWVLLTGGVFTLMGYTVVEQNGTYCKRVIINIDYGRSDTLITRKDVNNILKYSGNRLKGQMIGYINFEKIEKELRKQPYVSSIEVFNNLEGTVEINIVQRQPILRIFNEKNESFYLDASGKVLPVNPLFSARVPVANGYIREPYIKNLNYSVDSVRKKDSLVYNSVMTGLYKLANYIINNKFLKSQIQQIYVDKTGEFELIPLFGNHIIAFGNAEDIENKFERLVVFYKKGLNKTGWTKYRIINVKYQNQVVCTKI